MVTTAVKCEVRFRPGHPRSRVVLSNTPQTLPSESWALDLGGKVGGPGDPMEGSFMLPHCPPWPVAWKWSPTNAPRKRWHISQVKVMLGLNCGKKRGAANLGNLDEQLEFQFQIFHE